VFAQRRGNERCVEHGTEHRHDFGARTIGASGLYALAHFHLNIVERGLGMLEQHDARRTLAQQLAHQLRADRTACPGHHDALAARGARQQIADRRHAIAAQQIIDIERPQVGHRDAA
jgi:hypothetical protein